MFSSDPCTSCPFRFKQCRQSRHRRAAHTDEMNRHSTPASSMINRGLPFAMTRARTPNGRVTSGPVVWPDGNPYTTGPSKSLSRSASTARADGSPPGSLQSRKFSEDQRRRRTSEHRPGAAESACDRFDRAALRHLQETARVQPVGLKEYGVPSDATSCASVPPSNGPAASPFLNVSRAGACSSPSGSGLVNARTNESRS